jgi:hypothetical protein
MRNGDFSELSTSVYDPYTTPRRAFAGNVIPANRFDPIARKLILAYPEPNRPGLAGNYSYNGPEWQTNQTTDFRIDHRLSANDTIFARYSYNLTDGLTPSQCPATTIDGIAIDPTCIPKARGHLFGPHSFAHNVAATGSAWPARPQSRS